MTVDKRALLIERIKNKTATAKDFIEILESREQIMEVMDLQLKAAVLGINFYAEQKHIKEGEDAEDGTVARDALKQIQLILTQAKNKKKLITL